MTPLTFEPIIKQIRWGGRRLGSVLGKSIGDAADYAESWEIADHGDDQSVVVNGKFSGCHLSDLVREHGDRLLGEGIPIQQFPLLIKYLDASDWLSLQVHPNDAQAKTYNPNENGKTEAWIIIDAQPGSKICAGLKQGTTPEQFRSHLEAGTVEECLNLYEVHPGDCVFVPAGTVHAIGEGILLAEVQQQSNITFRLHDWGRMGSDGKPRELHIEESMACTDFARGPVGPVVPRVIESDHLHEELVNEQYFTIHRHRSDSEFEILSNNRFRILMVLDGSAAVRTHNSSHTLTKGATILVPAETPVATVEPVGNVTLLDVTVPAV